jgi:hypothetical protein
LSAQQQEGSRETLGFEWSANLQDEKQDDSRISTLFGIKIDSSDDS